MLLNFETICLNHRFFLELDNYQRMCIDSYALTVILRIHYLNQALSEETKIKGEQNVASLVLHAQWHSLGGRQG